ncbi:NUDIX hydrolase [Gordonia terrae]|uniref:NUDIX hydrolase n=1 Tax=Gordonia terrae TaxID=2055 RepID=UPI003F6C7850
MTPRPDAEPGPLIPAEEIPPWLRALTADVAAVSRSVDNRGGDRSRWASMLPTKTRSAAVLVLFSGSWESADDHPGGLPADAEVLLTERASTLRQHSGQVAFPGGAADPGDDFPVGTALREATEETGLDASGVRILATLPSFPVGVSGFDVVPVIGYWHRPSDVRVVDEGETARVDRVNLRELLSPDNRFQVRRKAVGIVYKGPAFFVDNLLVWGFTGGLIAAISEVAGWDRPWDKDDVRSLEKMIELAGSAQESGFEQLHPDGRTPVDVRTAESEGAG